MPPTPNRIEVEVEGIVRGTSENPATFGFVAADVTVSTCWGLQPGTAVLTWVAANQAAIAPLTAITIKVGGHIFRGITSKSTPVISSDGNTLTQEFVDSRALLQFDQVFGVFNRRHDWVESGQFYRGYKSLLPANYNTNNWTFHTAAYSAAQILDLMFGAPTVETAWLRTYAGSYMNTEVYEIDCEKGKALGTAVMEVSQKVGTTFTLSEATRYGLVWVVKGIGDEPIIPADADSIRQGLALSENPSRIRILGERNLYHTINVQMEPDWRGAWEQFFNIDEFWHDLFQYEATEADIANIPKGTRYNGIAGDTGFIIGKQLASARARTITVGQYADLRAARTQAVDGEAFRDYRKFAGRSRLQLPAALYIQEILFRAFRIPSGFTVRNPYGGLVPLSGIKIVNDSLVEISHNPSTGKMTYTNVVASASSGYAIIKGYMVGSDAYKTLNPDQVDLSKWVSAQDIWQHVVYRIDESGENDQSQFILFDQPVFRVADILTFPVINAVQQDYPTFKANPVFTAPPVRAALCLLAENFSYYAGEATNTNIQGQISAESAVRDGVENVSGLAGQFVLDANGGPPTEIPYADGETAFQKAETIAGALLNRQYILALGGYRLPRSVPTYLTSMIDRVTVQCSAAGLSEEVDLTSERDRNIGPNGVQLEPPRDLERRAALAPLFPGQQDLNEQSRKIKNDAAYLRANPQIRDYIMNLFGLYYGLDNPAETIFINGGTGTLPGGTPLFGEAVNDEAPTKAVMPNDAAAGTGALTNPQFIGITLADGESVDGNHPAHFTATGSGGQVYARVAITGPMPIGTRVGLATNNVATTYLVAGTRLAVATLSDDYSNPDPAQIGTIRLVKLKLISPTAEEPHFPFEIFQAPHNPAALTTDTPPAPDYSADWRTFRVRLGTLNLSGGPLVVLGTDGDPAITGAATNPDDTATPAYSSVCDFAVLSGELWYVWIDNTSPSLPEVNAAAAPPVGGWTTTSGWNDGGYILLGWIDCATDAAKQLAHVRQMVRTDLFCIPAT